jgi:hypothetical protein
MRVRLTKRAAVGTRASLTKRAAVGTWASLTKRAAAPLSSEAQPSAS